MLTDRPQCQLSVSWWLHTSHGTMESTYTSKQHGGRSSLGRLLLLLLFLTDAVLSNDDESHEAADGDDKGLKIACVIVGPDYVTVGVPSSIECISNCTSCTYSMSLDGQSAQGQGNVLAFTVTSWLDVLTVNCTVAGDDGQSVTASKRLQVLAGPANISITGPELMSPAASHTCSCHAYCRPACTYTWRIDKGPWISGQGNVVSITPQETDNSKVLICKATNPVSGLFVDATRTLSVISGPSDVQIEGPDEVEIAKKNKFVCTAACHPSCRYVSSVDNQTVRGNVIEMTVDLPLKSVTLRCEAQNTVSRKTVTAFKTVHITSGADRHPSSSAALLLAFIISAAFTL